MVNRRFPCNIRDDFSGVPAIKKFFMDRLHLLYFLEKGLCRFPVKMLQRQYHVSIMFLSRLYQDFLQSMTFFRMGERGKMPPLGSPAAAEIKGLGTEKAAGNFPAARVLFCRWSEKVIIFNMLHYVLNAAMQNVT